jgi:hypothetical protein
VPVPLHACILTTVPWQVGLPHVVPDAHRAQAPVPLHTPVCPQVDMAVAVQALPGSLPAAALPQTPVVQAWQTPLQAVLQQMPSTQKPDWHCDGTEHALPSAAWLTQAPPTQESPGTQSAAVVQELSQAPAEQT